MGKALSVQLRERAVAAYRVGGRTQAEVALLFQIGEASLRRWLRRERETGDMAPIVDFRRGPARKMGAEHMACLEEILATNNDATNDELVELLAERTGLTVSASSISRAIARLGWTRKKSHLSPPRPSPPASKHSARSGRHGERP